MNDVASNAGMARPDNLLQPGETAIWWDKPSLMVFARHEIIKAAICILAAAILLFAWWRLPQIAAYQNYLFVAVFILAAVGATALVDVAKGFFSFGGTVYLMTDQRLVVSRNGAVKDMPIADARKILVFPLKDGHGDVKFFNETKSVKEQLASGVMSGTASVLDLIPTETLVDGFMCVANAAAVEAMIRARQAAA